MEYRIHACAGLMMLAAMVPANAKSPCKPADVKLLVLEGDTAVDPKGNLVWKRCAVGMTFNAKAGCLGEAHWLSQREAREAAKKAGNGWRVPKGEEMQSLLRDTCSGPKTDTRAFPDVKLNDSGEGVKFWTVSQAMPGMYYYFEFIDGFADAHTEGYRLPVRLVRTRSGP